MRVNREIIALIFLLLVFVAGGLLLTGRDNTKSHVAGLEKARDPSIYNDRASGSMGCFEWVGKLGYVAAPWRENWSRLAETKASVLLVIDPETKPPMLALTGSASGGDNSSDSTVLAPNDAKSLLAWVRSGHTAILMASRLATGRIAGEKGGTGTFGDALDLLAESSSSSGRIEFSPLQPSRDTMDVLSVHSRADARLRRRSPDGVALFGDAAGPLVLSIPVGAGRLVAIADSWFACNANLPRSENAAFLANILATAAHPGAIVLFDEYHHGYADLTAQTDLWTAIGRPPQLALIQCALALVVLAAVLSSRFGNPIPLGRGVTRTSTEYVTSLASLYRRAQASPAALETLYRSFLRDISARLALPPDVSLERLADAASRHGGVDKSALRRLLATCEQRLDAGKIGESELLDLVRQMESVRKDMGIA